MNDKNTNDTTNDELAELRQRLDELDAMIAAMDTNSKENRQRALYRAAARLNYLRNDKTRLDERSKGD